MPALPSLRQLGYLVAVADRLSFTQAAEACFVTQSTLSAGIKELEATLGARLVERDRQNVMMTPLGIEVADRARALLAAAEDLAQLVQGAAEPMSGVLRLGAIPTIAPFVLPRVLPQLRARYPKARLALREDLTGNLLERLRAGALDVALIALPYDTTGLLVEELWGDEFWLVAREGDPAARSKRPGVSAVAADRLLLLEEGHCLRDHTLAGCGLAQKANPSGMEATSLLTLVQMVESGLGIALVPEMALKAGILKGTALVALPIAAPAPRREIALVARASTARREEFGLLADLMREVERRAQSRAVPRRRG
ncbi:MAG TPA: hydrogen peroxide-inducible genes activator [Burkholderiales bacterium]|nr:hydrogen peroxide-inducible genes activator [Burkholderiales bacterium]